MCGNDALHSLGMRRWLIILLVLGAGCLGPVRDRAVESHGLTAEVAVLEGGGLLPRGSRAIAEGKAVDPCPHVCVLGHSTAAF